MPGTTSIDGLSSGLDTTSIVDSIISFERTQAVYLENEQALKTNIVSALSALQAKFLSLQSQLATLSRPRTFENFAADISDEDYLSASTSGRVGNGSFDVQVLSLARNHQIASQGFDDQSGASLGTGSITIKVGAGIQKTITIDENSNSLTAVAEAINDAKAGVTASVINDGSESGAYRLLLSGTKTGAANAITVESSLTGGNNLNFNTSSFDSPEIVSKNLSTTSAINLGSSAAFAGSSNKIYSFTVKGTGAQTIGDGPILIDWTDGVNSGTIAVTQADMEVILAGDGADGLTLNFSAGTLTAGDKFEVATFAPTLQEAADAKIAIGSTGGYGSAITVSSDTNTFEDIVSGLDLTAKKVTAPGESINVSTRLDTEAIRKEISTFLERYNDIQEFINDQNRYDTETEESGILFADQTVITLQSSLRRALANGVKDNNGFSHLSTIGIRSDADGKLSIKDSAAFEKALAENLDEVIALFTTSGASNSTGIEYISAGEEIVNGTRFDVNITQAASQGYFKGALIDDPAMTPLVIDDSNNKLQLIVDGVISDVISLQSGTYHSYQDLVDELQAKMDADNKIGTRNATVTWVEDANGQGYLSISSANFGSSAYVGKVDDVSDSAYSLLGIAAGTSVKGNDVQGTINGEPATGRGQYLTGDDENETTANLQLKITLTEAQLATDGNGSITINKGIAAVLSDRVSSATRATDGLFDRRIASYKRQIELLQDRVEDIDERLDIRRETLLAQFYAMETTLSELSSQSTYLQNQLAQITANWNSKK